MRKKLTIRLDAEVYESLHRTVGQGNISRFIESLVRPHLLQEDLEAAYRHMAEDSAQEAEAREWAEALIGEVNNDPA